MDHGYATQALNMLSRLKPPVLRWAAGGLGALTAPTLSILIFHRVLAEPDPLFPGEVDAAHFDRLMALLARSFRVVTLGRALTMLQAGSLPSRTLVITFDDGYADNAEIALPILQRHGLAATFFISTGFLDGGRMWNDSVIDNLRCCSLQRIDFGEFGLGSLALETIQQRRTAIDALLPKIKYLPLQAREDALKRIGTLCGSPTLPRELMMRSDQVVQLHRAGMELGGHTVHHPILTALADAEAEHEIAAGRHSLQRLIDAPVDVFAYPNGRPGQDYDLRHVLMARRIGFRGAVSTAVGAAKTGADRFQLPRYTPWERSLTIWAARLLGNFRHTTFETADFGADS